MACVCVARRGQACYIPLAHKDGDKSSDSDLFCEDEPTGALLDGQIPLDEALDLLRPMLEDESILKIGQNIKFDIKILSRYNINPAPINDTMLLSYALHGGLHNHGMDSLSERYLDHKPISIKQVLVNGRTTITFDKVAIDDATRYAAEDADITLRLWQTLKPRLHAAKVTRVYETLERPLVPVLCQMERLGIKVDKAALAKLSNGFAASIAVLEGQIFEQAGQSFNVGSPKQLGEILFDKTGVRGWQTRQNRSLRHGGGCSGRLGGRRCQSARIGAGLAAFIQVKEHLYRCLANPYQPRYWAGSYQLCYIRGKHRATGFQ